MCADCLAGAHPALSCAEAAAKRRGDIDALLGAVRAISADGGAQQCPYCDVVVERTEGCNFMACTCGHAFCYVWYEFIAGACISLFYSSVAESLIFGSHFILPNTVATS